MTPTDENIRTYFDRAASPDPEAYFHQFAPDAVVEDEGHHHRGIAEIRGWRTSVAPVSSEVLETTVDDGITTARARISGDFPGSPVTLTFRFAFDDSGLIRSLTIGP